MVSRPPDREGSHSPTVEPAGRPYSPGRAGSRSDGAVAAAGAGPPRFARWLGRLDSDRVHLALGGLVLALAWARLVFGDVSLLVFQDASEQTYAWWQYSVGELQRGSLPLWDPYTSAGRSHIGEGQEGVFYPPFLLLAGLGGGWASSVAAIHLFAFLHALLGFGGAYLLARALGMRRLAALGCGLTFALGGFFSLRALGQLNIFNATAWVPFVVAGPFLVARTRAVGWALLSGVALALSILAGHGQPALHAGVVLVLALAFLAVVPVWPARPALGPGRALAALLVAGSSGAALAAIQLLPLFEYQPLALRWVGGDEPVLASAHIPFDVVASNPSLEPALLPTVVFQGVGQIPEASLYVGAAAIVLAARGALLHRSRQRLFWLSLLSLGLVLSLGAATPLLRPVHELVPLVDKVREPVRYLLLAHVGLAALVGLGIDQAAGTRPGWRALGLALGLGGLLVGGALGSVAAQGPLSAQAVRGLLVGGLAALLAVALALVPGRARPGRLLGPVAAVAILAAELGLAWSSALPAVRPYDGLANREVSQHYSSPEAEGVARFLAGQPGLYRVDLTDTRLPKNYGEMLRIPTVGGYRATSPIKVFRLRQRLGFRPPDRGPDLLGTRFLVSAEPLRGVREVARAGALGIYENPRAFPLAWLVGDARAAASEEEALRLLSDGRLDLRETAIVTGQAGTLPALAPATASSAEVTEYQPSLVRVATRSGGPALLVTSQPDYPGWVALVDGAEVSRLAVDYAFVGVAVPGGEHTVELVYRPGSVRLGAAISLLALTVCAALVLRWLAPASRRRPAAVP
jgi:hypothetical protein